MGRLLDKLLATHPAYDIERDEGGFLLTAKPDRIDEFSDLVREATEHAGEDFLVFPTSTGVQGYSRMFVVPLDEVAPPSP